MRDDLRGVKAFFSTKIFQLYSLFVCANSVIKLNSTALKLSYKFEDYANYDEKGGAAEYQVAEIGAGPQES